MVDISDISIGDRITFPINYLSGRKYATRTVVRTCELWVYVKAADGEMVVWPEDITSIVKK